MRILFSTSSFGFLRNFQSTIRLLAERGHEIHLLAERTDTVDGQKIAEALVAEYPSITSGFLPSGRHRLWYALGTGVRASLDYWRYLDRRWDDAPKLRGRAATLAPAFARLVAGWPMCVGALQSLFRAIDRALPPSPGVVEVFERVKPDILLLTPLLYFRSHQVDHVRCARQLGIRSIVGIGSWDHLTTKGLIHAVPDRVLVWNEAQKHEAVELHGVPAERVAVTGSQAYDHWFEMKPSVDRDTFCASVGLDPSRPILLYLCSSSFIAPQEVGFVRRWISTIRGSRDARLRGVGLLVRPHPQNTRQWRDVDLPAEFENVALWPKAGANPIGGAARADYFHSMYHAEAVVGVNTSSMIESGIIGRPVYAVEVEEFAATQDGTLHFQHLKHVEGGLLHLAGSVDEHVEQLARLPEEAEVNRHRGSRFIRTFVRPHGFDAAATPLVVSEIEQFVAGPPLGPVVASPNVRIFRKVLAPAAFVLTITSTDRAKLKAIALQWSRPARLRFRALLSRMVYWWRMVRRLPGRVVRLARRMARVIVVRPARWAIHRARLAAHAFVTWRKGEPDEVG